MKLIIAGSRRIEVSSYCIRDILINYDIDCTVIESEVLDVITEIVSGGADGIDRCGEKLASKYHIPLKKFPTGWETHGKAAVPIRNRQMAEYADALLLIWDGESKGSANMKMEMLSMNKPVYEVIMRKL